MLYYIIPLIIIIVSLLILIFIIIKKLPNISAINVESIVQEKESKVRNRLIQDRLARKFFNLKKLLVEIFKPLAKDIASAGDKAYQKIIKLENKNLKQQPLKKIDLNQEVKEKLELAGKHLAEENFAKAEEICIGIIELDSANMDAYELLAEIYIEQKEYKKARETCRYLIKLLTKNKAETDGNGKKHRLANCYADLGLVYQLENKQEQALTNFQKSVDLEPNNPRFLDLLLKISIMLKNKSLALQVFNDLKKADSKNKKLKDLKQEIDNIIVNN